MQFLLLLTFLLTPAYVIRFSLFKFPTDALMVWVILFWVIFCIWLLAKHQFNSFYQSIKTLDKKILALTGLFFLAGIISLFVHGFDRQKLGQFIVLFLQPISVFFIASFIFKQNPQAKDFLLSTFYFLLALAGLYAILQYFTLVGLPPAWWGNSDEPKRAVSFFVHPNFYALWCAPLLAFLIPDVARRFIGLIGQPINGHATLKNIAIVISWVLGCLGLLFSLSRAGWLGLGIAIGAYALVAADNKIRKIIFGAVIVIVIIIFSVPNLRWRLLLPFYGEKSAISRFSLWNTGWKGVKESPITGLGLTGFSRQWPSLNTDPGLTEAHNFPHNIFLDLWVETGLIGLIGMVGLVGIMIYYGLKDKHNIFRLGVALFLIAMVCSGLVDNPYFKNDLAMVFWLILSLSI